MADKVLTATSICIGHMQVSWDPIGIALEDSAGTASVRISCPYRFCDSGDNILPMNAGEQEVKDTIGNLPQNVQDGIIAIRDHLESLALTAEGM